MQKTMKIGLVVVLLIAVGVVVAMKTRGSRSRTDASADRSAIAPTAADTEAPLPRLVDVGAGKCIPCKMMAPILQELKEEHAGRLRVEVYDLTVEPSAQERFSVRLIPTQVFYDPVGNEMWRHEGFMSKEEILAKWKELGFDLTAGPATQPEDEGSDRDGE